jgi:enolase
VSLAVAKAAAEASGLPLYRYVGGAGAHVLPVPMMNIINGGAHADNPIDFQEFMIMPVGASKRSARPCGGRRKSSTRSRKAAEGCRPQHQCRRRRRLRAEPARARRRRSTSSWPPSRRLATSPANRSLLALDCASTEFFKDGNYVYEGEKQDPRSQAQAKYLAKLAADYPIISIEDGMAEDDWEGWKTLTDLCGKTVPAGGRRSVRDQLGAAAPTASRMGVANSILVKVNQIGSLTETLDAVETAHKAAIRR